ncbi:nicotinate-nucleotide diphosphorylase (carboxylating) [Acetobacteraceae bacterium EV16G]|uniref:nicotinate-nucleotide diphosphorylase (carboxylating) n=1 Tax=Sorlinia euscelidii TaxID=3081148 RepID=A0ABU7TZ74_9PROT
MWPRHLPDLEWRPIIEAALREDLGIGGDVTSQLVIDPSASVRAVFRARKAGVLAGLPAARLAFSCLDPQLHFTAMKQDGDRLHPGDVIAEVSGNARSILAAERTALNLLSHLSGIASVTRQIVDKVARFGTRVTCTRKTLPGLRALQKYAVSMGGGHNHRYRLDDAVMIKDNHIAIAGGIASALTMARRHLGHMMKISLEVDSLEQLEAAIVAGGADIYLLDNMSPELLRRAVKRVARTAITEASGGITPETAASVAATGVDVISLGWLTHSVTALDIGLDIDSAS